MVEIIGIVASVFIVISFLFKSERNIRIVNTIGGVLFLIYGCLISSTSTILLQSILVLIQIIKINKLRKEN